MMESLKSEVQSKEQTYKTFFNDVRTELEGQNEFKIIREDEKKLNQEIKKTTEEHRNLMEEHLKDTNEATQEIIELKKAVNEAEVDAKLSL